jgi:hypothetical protein
MELDDNQLRLANPTRLSNRAFGIQPVAANARKAADPVKRRRVLYIAGYDPRGPEEAARRILEREAKRMSARADIEVVVTQASETDHPLVTAWEMVAEEQSGDKGEHWRVETEFLYLRWDDLVAPDFAIPYRRRIVGALSLLIDYLLSGALFRMFAASHSVLFLWLYPPIAVIVLVLAGLLAGSWATVAVEQMIGLGAFGSGLLGAAIALGIIAIGRGAMSLGYWGHLMLLWLFCRDYALGLRPDVEDRCEAFGKIIASQVARKDVDETVIIGHSYGCMLAMEATGAALIEHPESFEQGAPVVLANVASCAGTSLLRNTCRRTRARIKALASSRALVWLEVQGKQDLINYYRADPVVMAGIEDDDTRPNPVIRGLSLKDLVTPATYSRIRKDFFRNHHQTIMANDHDYPWELPRNLCGPRPIPEIANNIVRKYLYHAGVIANPNKKKAR